MSWFHDFIKHPKTFYTVVIESWLGDLSNIVKVLPGLYVFHLSRNSRTWHLILGGVKVAEMSIRKTTPSLCTQADCKINTPNGSTGCKLVTRTEEAVLLRFRMSLCPPTCKRKMMLVARYGRLTIIIWIIDLPLSWPIWAVTHYVVNLATVQFTRSHAFGDENYSKWTRQSPRRWVCVWLDL